MLVFVFVLVFGVQERSSRAIVVAAGHRSLHYRLRSIVRVHSLRNDDNERDADEQSNADGGDVLHASLIHVTTQRDLTAHKGAQKHAQAQTQQLQQSHDGMGLRSVVSSSGSEARWLSLGEIEAEAG